MLDLLYTQIMSDIPEEDLSTIKLLLGFYLLRLQTPPRLKWGLMQVSYFLGLGQHETYAALSKLYSVLNYPPPENANYDPVVFFHASFSDFLLDSSRSQAYFIDLSAEATRLWQHCTEILRQCEVHHGMLPFLSSFASSNKGTQHMTTSIFFGQSILVINTTSSIGYGTTPGTSGWRLFCRGRRLGKADF